MPGMPAETTVIGIDFSTDPAKTGLARATVDVVSETGVLHEVCTATAKLRPRTKTVARWIGRVRRDMPVLVAIDAPLGWPDAMRGPSFASHLAGHPVEICADLLFSRETDRDIEDRIKKKPLEVGANLIARSAYGALRFLRELSDEINGHAAALLRLAWSHRDLADGPCVVEVYPAATMKAHRIPTGSYRKSGSGGREDREAIAECLRDLGLELEIDTAELVRNDHVLDAAVCVLAGWDFLAEVAKGPDLETRAVAEREGWIWARMCDV